MKLVLLALTAVATLAAEPTICGSRPTHPHVDYLEVSCVDFEALAKLSPFFAGRGRETRVLIHAKRGEAVSVTIGGVTKFASLVTDSYGRRLAMLRFDGVEHTSLEVKVFTEEK